MTKFSAYTCNYTRNNCLNVWSDQLLYHMQNLSKGQDLSLATADALISIKPKKV